MKLLTVIFFTLVILFIPIRAYAGQLAGRTIILDPGHGEGNSPRYGAYVEHIAMLGLAREIRPLLEAHGATVVLVRDGFPNVHIAARAAIINKVSLEALLNERIEIFNEHQFPETYAEIREINRLIAIMQRIIRAPGVYAPIYFNYPFDREFQTTVHPDLHRIFMWQTHRTVSHNFLMISLHSNANRNPNVNGAIVYHTTNCHHNGRTYFAGYTTYIKTGIFANYLLGNISRIGMARARNTAWPGNFLVLRENNLPSVLVENGYHTNPNDRAMLMCSIFMTNLAHAYVNAIIDYFNTIDPRIEIYIIVDTARSRLEGIINRLQFSHPGILRKEE